MRVKKENVRVEIEYVVDKQCFFVALFNGKEIVIDPQTGHPPLLFADDAETLWEHVDMFLSCAI